MGPLVSAYGDRILYVHQANQGLPTARSQFVGEHTSSRRLARGHSGVTVGVTAPCL